MRKDYKKMNLYDLIIELETVNRELDRIKNDPDYIKQETARIFGNKPRRDHKKEIAAIIDAL